MKRQRIASCLVLSLVMVWILTDVASKSFAQPDTESAAKGEQTPQPRRGRGQGRRGARGPAIMVEPPADAELVEKVPPLDKNGNFKVAIEGTWPNVPPVMVPEGVPRGTVTMFTLSSDDSKFYTSDRGSYVRNLWVYVPAGYVEGTELPLMVDHDARAISHTQATLITVMDTLIAEKRLPMMGAVFIANGSESGGPRDQRSVEYDTVSGKYAEFIEAEVLPLAEKTGHVKFTKNPDARGVIGVSSGAACALSMAWFHNDLYRRVISYSGSFTNLRRDETAPHGAWEFHENLIPNSDKKPIRIWLQVGSRDNGATSSEESMNNWCLANNRLAEVLKAKGYDYQYLWTVGAPHAENGVTRLTLAEAMEWLWKDYEPKQ